jgi:hypothetical protein
MEENPYRSPATTDRACRTVRYRPPWEVARRAGVLAWLSLFGCFVATIAIFPWVFGRYLIPTDFISLAISALVAVVVSGLLAVLVAVVAAVLQVFHNSGVRRRPDRGDRP